MWEFSDLHYQCNRILTEILDADGPMVRPLSLPSRRISIKEISRNIAPRPRDLTEDRRRLQKLPVFLYNSAPESEIMDEFKDKVWNVIDTIATVPSFIVAITLILYVTTSHIFSI